ncbi:hypothetical protein N9I19_22335 [Peribacillus sp. CSMR9]|nr:hypothetical protein [Peribacillus sp. CSMR9]
MKFLSYLFRLAAAIAAYEWFQQIKREYAFSGDFKVVYNGDIDITELVKRLTLQFLMIYLFNKN